jgi:hypothetical protein
MRTPLLGMVLLSVTAASLAFAFEPASHITRGLYCDPSPLMSSGHWTDYGTGFVFTQETAHSGQWSLKCVNAVGPGKLTGAGQRVKINQTVAAPIKISGWSKAQDVAARNKSFAYSLYVDLRYQDGESLFMQLATFSPGTHDWEYSEFTVNPAKPLASASFYVLLRDLPGTAWFDDVFLGPPGGENLLRNAGFEPTDRRDDEAKAAMYADWDSLNANAMHIYLSGNPKYWTGEDGKGNPHVSNFLKEAAARGIGVFLTTGGPEVPVFKDSHDPNFPQYECVNGAWGAAWRKGLAAAAAYDFAGISMVPDEYNWLYYSLQERYAKATDPKVVEFYKNLPAMCDCPLCQARYEKQFGRKLPALPRGLEFPEQTRPSLDYLQMRYDSTTDWIRQNCAAVQAVNPRVRTDSLICVSPVCSDFWWGTGVAWDRLPETKLDYPTTDPYILLHNYVGDSTHWYVTETASHLTAASAKRQCGIVLEICRLREDSREDDPVEIYGSALTAVSHGAKELAYFIYSCINGQAKISGRPEVSRAAVTGVYSILKQADPWLGGLQPLKRVALLYSRASDDAWRFYTKPQPSPVLTHPVNDVRYSSIAQKEVLYTLYRRGVPVDLYYLDSVQPEQLTDYPIIVVPFAFAVRDETAKMLERLAKQGKTVVIISEVGTVNERGEPRDKPALLGVCGLRSAPGDETPVGAASYAHFRSVSPTPDVRVLTNADGVPTVWERRTGQGRVVYLAGSFGNYGLVANRDRQKRTTKERIYPNPLSPVTVSLLEKALLAGGAAPWVIDKAEAQRDDLEVTCCRNDRGELIIFAINWDDQPTTGTAQAPGAASRLNLPGSAKTAQGFVMGPEGKVRPSTLDLKAPLDLQGQEAGVWRVN